MIVDDNDWGEIDNVSSSESSELKVRLAESIASCSSVLDVASSALPASPTNVHDTLII
jgi:hypothetical protein